MPLYPIVPDTPGVPPVNRNATNSSVPPVFPVTGDSGAVSTQANSTPQWGLFTPGGANVLSPDSVVALDDFMHEFKLSTFPIEQGSFATFNKVATPFEGRFIFNKGGSTADRQDFMSNLEIVVADLNLYVLATPEISYSNVNVNRYRLRRRSDQGFQLISVEISMEEIRVAASPAFSNTQDPTAQGPSTTGAVQPALPTTAQVAQAQGAISPEGVGTLVPGVPPTPPPGP
jgi:hypothetical protein